MNPSRLSAIAALIGLPIVTSCAESTSPNNDACGPETTSVVATVSVGASVVFDWSPACPVAMLLIEEAAGDAWWISADDDALDSPQGNLIRPKVTYGQVPSGITDSMQPVDLVPGRTYELVLWRILPAGSTAQCQARFGSACLLTVKEFTR